MSKANFDPSDRMDPKHTGNQKIRLMARSGGFVMVRYSRMQPYVLTEKEWAKLPKHRLESGTAPRGGQQL